MIRKYDDFIRVWDTSPIVVLDTNALIDIYYFSSETGENILNNLELVKSNLWLANITINEYERNHKDKREAAFKKYDHLSSDIKEITKTARKEIKKAFHSANRYQFPKANDLSIELCNKVNEMEEMIKKYKVEIDDEINKTKELLKEDKVRTLIEMIEREGNIGREYHLNELLSIYTEGEQRYKYLMPPGYLDVVKDKKDPTKTKKFGDLVMWKQIIERAQTSRREVILVSDDRKDDWWDNQLNRPRVELTKEFERETSTKIHFTKLIDFISNLAKLNDLFSISTIIEISSDELVREYILDSNHEIKGTLAKSITDKISDELLSEIDLYYEIRSEISVDELSSFNIKSPVFDGCDVLFDETYTRASFYCPFRVKVEASIEQLKSHGFSFELELDISLSIDAKIEHEGSKYSIDYNEIEFLNFEIIGIDDYVDHDEICVICGNKYGDYIHHYDGLVCESCMSRGEHVEVCTKCGEVFPTGELVDGTTCVDCTRTD